MFFRRLQLPQNDGLSVRPGARVDHTLLRLTLSASRKFTTLEVKEHQPTVACCVRHRGSMAFCSGSSQPGTRLIIARVAARIFRTAAPSVSRIVTPPGCCARGRSHQPQRPPVPALQH